MRRFATFFATILVMLGIAVAPASASSVVDREVWIGSPVTGTWNANASSHHWLGNATDQGDWATDIKVGAGTQVKVYLAPQTSGYTVTAKVTQIANGCVSGNGAKMVAVGVYVNGTKIGSVKYAHVNPSVSVGQAVNRWGGVIGTVAGGLPYNANCWTGPHNHVEGFNVHNFSCYNRGFGIGSHVNVTNFVGFIGGKRVSGARQACP